MAPFFDPEENVDTERRRLPHWQQENAWVFVTWRLADSLPRDLLNAWTSERADWIALHPQPWDEATELEYHSLFTNKIEQHLDAGHGSCLLQEQGAARIVEADRRADQRPDPKPRPAPVDRARPCEGSGDRAVARRDAQHPGGKQDPGDVAGQLRQPQRRPTAASPAKTPGTTESVPENESTLNNTI